MASSPRANRGPSAASENRAALIGAARSIFATHGLDAPLSSVARLAGVGQGSLYRHFPTRASLAVAVYRENIGELETLAEGEGATLGDLLRAITEQATESTAFFEMIEIERADADTQDLSERINAVVESLLPAAKASGAVPVWATTKDILLGVAMLTGALSKTPHADRAAAAVRIWNLLPFGPTDPH